jgi:hypothetical protein
LFFTGRFLQLVIGEAGWLKGWLAESAVRRESSPLGGEHRGSRLKFVATGSLKQLFSEPCWLSVMAG